MRFPEDVPTLTDGVVTLRAHTADDAAGVYEQCRDPLSQEWTTVPVPYSRTDAEDFIRAVADQWSRDEGWFFAIEAVGGSGPTRFGGTVQLRPLRGGLAEIGYGAHPGVRGKGVTTRAVRLLLDWAFEATPTRTVRWYANAGNVASWRVAWHNGFSFDGSAREYLPQRGDLLDAWIGSVRASDPPDPKSVWLVRPVLEGRHVRLRAPRPDDANRCVEATTDPTTWHWLAEYGAPKSVGDFLGWLRDAPISTSQGRGYSWTVADRETDTYLATLNLFDVNGIDYASGELGYWSHPDARGRGVMREAIELAKAELLRRAADGGLGLERLQLHISEGNDASERLAAATGFARCGFDRRTSKLGDGSVVGTAKLEYLAHA